MIRIHITDENDLLDKYDAERNTLNPSFVSFVEKQFDEKRDASVIIIESEQPVDEERVRVAVRHNMEVEKKKNRKLIRHNRLMELYLFLIGIVCIVAGIFLNNINPIYMQVLSLTAGFAIKEAATFFFMKSPKAALSRARILYISRAELRFERSAP